MANWTTWLSYAALCLLFLLLLAAEMLRPLHREPREGKGRLLANFGLGAINAALLWAVPFSTVATAQWASGEGLGLINLLGLPFAAAAAATILVRSLASYAIHRLSHRLPLLWRIHRVHHADTALDLSTGLRNHPLELAFVVPWVAGVTIAFGLHAPTLLVYETAAVAFAFWDHANLRLPAPLDRILRVLLVTPAMHHVHHSAVQTETDSNYGDVLSLWDRLFGTYRGLDDEALREMRLGLGDAFDPAAASLVGQLRSPLAAAAAPRSLPSKA